MKAITSSGGQAKVLTGFIAPLPSVMAFFISSSVSACSFAEVRSGMLGNIFAMAGFRNAGGAVAAFA